MKTCNRCFETKDESAFYKNKLIGLLNQCKSCVAKAQAAYKKTAAGKEVAKRERAKHADKYAEWKRDWKKTAKGRLAAKRYQRPQEKLNAKKAVQYAVRVGKLIPLPCFICGSKAQAHHCSYAPEMKLAVTWLCQPHHNSLHLEHHARTAGVTITSPHRD